MELCNNECIVTFMDLIDVKKKIEINSPNAVQIMQKFHQEVYGQISMNMENHQHAYTWNDSVLLIANITKKPNNIKLIMKEADELKKRIDSICKCYAISVKGMSFSPPLLFSGNVFEGQVDQPKFIFLKASSYAFSNCFEIEKKLSSYEKSWYIDERINSKINSPRHSSKKAIKMLPSNEERNIHMYDTYLW